MSKAPTTKPANTREVKNGYVYYTYWTLNTLKNGKVVFHKKTDARKLKCIDTREKNNYFNKARRQITHNTAFTLDDIKKFYDIIAINPNEFKKWIDERKIIPVVA